VRVVSLVPSVTETLLAWGITPVAVTRFCDAPGVPTVGGTKNPDVAAIVALSPDLVVMDKEENRVVDADALRDANLDVHATHVTTLADVAPTLVHLAAAVGARPGASAAQVAADAPVRPTAGPHPRAWIPIWRRPWMTINGSTYGSSLLAAAGIDNVSDAAGDTYPTTTLEDAAALHPDVVLAPTEPYAFAERHRPELARVAPVTFVDGQDLFWWGSRTAGALSRFRALAATLDIP
jgi:ABC-type Fe3+-hydroxamate transport system substrate-binding protein